MKIKQKPLIFKAKSNQTFACIEIPNQYVDELNKIMKHDDITVEIIKTKVKRSLSANAMAWSLIHKMATKLNTTDEEVYIELLRSYGRKDYVAAPVDAEEILKRNYKIVEQIKECTVNDKKAMTFRLVTGSSLYNSKEMSTFIEGIIFECKKLNIETLPPDEIKRMIDMIEGV